jgi:hypothetical protein
MLKIKLNSFRSSICLSPRLECSLSYSSPVQRNAVVVRIVANGAYSLDLPCRGWNWTFGEVGCTVKVGGSVHGCSRSLTAKTIRGGYPGSRFVSSSEQESLGGVLKCRTRVDDGSLAT